MSTYHLLTKYMELLSVSEQEMIRNYNEYAARYDDMNDMKLIHLITVSVFMIWA